MASSNLQRLFLEAWKLAQMYNFELGNSGSLIRIHTNSLFD